jgi:hypothetical protein
MTPLIAVAYVSSAIRRYAPAELDALLLDARAFNMQAGVSGALLYQDGSFFQYFEGPEGGVSQAYARIKGSRMHRGLIELVRQPVPQRYFSTWSMGFAEPVSTALQAISQASWDSQREAAARPLDRAPGLELLLSFWDRAQGRR